MCITLLSTAHPEYPFIFLNNRDEFLNRPTAHADWWDTPNQHVLGGRDLQRPERGTWLGITKQGHLANLTNFREHDVEISKEKSRGGLTNAYLTIPSDQVSDEEAFAKHLLDDIGIHNVGGFTLLFGTLRAPKDNDGSRPGLSVISNRTSTAEGVTRIATKAGETHGLSNSHFGDLTWPKIVHGERMLNQAIEGQISRNDSQKRFIESLFDVLSVDTLPRPKEDEDWPTYTRQLRNSILIPPVGGKEIESKSADTVAAADGATEKSGQASDVKVGEGSYGTQKQTVILVDREGHVTFVERTLYDAQGQSPQTGEKDRKFEYEIEGWED